MTMFYHPMYRRFLNLWRSARGCRQRRTSRPPLWRLQLEPLESRTLLSGVWTDLTNLTPNGSYGSGTMMLLTDGTVMVQGGGTQEGNTVVGGITNTWYKLTPDATGSYVNGNWTQLASMNIPRYAFASNVLNDAHGRVLVLGGEFTDPTPPPSPPPQTDSPTGEIYDPVTNTWSSIS